MAYLSLNGTLHTAKYKNTKVKFVADTDAQYLIWLHNSYYNVYMGRTVFQYLGLWEQYKNTPKCNNEKCKLK